MRPVVIIPAPSEPVAVDLTAWAIAALVLIGTLGSIGSVVCCLRILHWI